MTAYRDTSNYDPYAASDYGPPLRPYNWVQWTGVGLGVLGIVIDLMWFAGQAGVMPKLLDSPALGVSLPLFGVALINSRRDSAGTADPKSRRRRLALVIAGALGAAILGAAVVISLQFKAAI